MPEAHKRKFFREVRRFFILQVARACSCNKDAEQRNPSYISKTRNLEHIILPKMPQLPQITSWKSVLRNKEHLIRLHAAGTSRHPPRRNENDGRCRNFPREPFLGRLRALARFCHFFGLVALQITFTIICRVLELSHDYRGNKSNPHFYVSYKYIQQKNMYPSRFRVPTAYVLNNDSE